MHCIEAFLLQSFFNLILKGTNIVVCFCRMSNGNALAQIVFSKLVDIVLASLLFESLFYYLSHVLLNQECT